MEKKVVVRVEPGIVGVAVTDDTLSVDLDDCRADWLVSASRLRYTGRTG